VAADDQVIVLDLSDPTEPVPLSHVDLVNAERIAVAGRHAHVMSTGMDGVPLLDVIDISNPLAIERRGSLKWSSEAPEPHSLSAHRGIVAVADDDGITVIDARDPWNPTEGGRWNVANTTDAALVDGLAAVAHSSGDPARFGIQIVDASQLGSLRGRGFWQAPSDVVSVVAFGRDVAVATSGHGVFVVSLEDPDAPSAIDHWDGFSLGTVGLAAAWPNLVIANDRIGLIVLGLKTECLPPRRPGGRVSQ
jgi:hypothetical protein